MMGGVIYIHPCGWIRLALNVEGKYADDVWLKGNRQTTRSFLIGRWGVAGKLPRNFLPQRTIHRPSRI